MPGLGFDFRQVHPGQSLGQIEAYTNLLAGWLNETGEWYAAWAGYFRGAGERSSPAQTRIWMAFSTMTQSEGPHLLSPQSNQRERWSGREGFYPTDEFAPIYNQLHSPPRFHVQSLSRLTDVLAFSRVALVFLFPGTSVYRNCCSRAENSKTFRHCLYHWYGPRPNCLAQRENHAQESGQQHRNLYHFQ